MKKKYLALIFWVYIVALLVSTIIPWSTSEKVGFGGFKFRLDYWLHLGAYFGVAFLFILWQINVLIDRRFIQIILTLMACLCFAFGTEIIQLFVPGRTFNLKDFFANSVGILIAYSLFVLLKNKIRNSVVRYIRV